MNTFWILLIIYISIMLLITFGVKSILKAEKIEKPSLPILSIIGLLWPILLVFYIIGFIYEHIKNAILRI